MPFKKRRLLAGLVYLLVSSVLVAGSALPVRAPLSVPGSILPLSVVPGFSMSNPDFTHNRYLIAKAPNDPLQSRQNYLKQIHAEEAWDINTSGDSVIVAIVDTGVDLNHPDLNTSLVPGVNLLHPKDPPQDDNGHGTNVAGVIAAATNNDKGVAGLLWKARIMPVKALEADGTGSEDKLGEGIRYAVDHGAKIVVLSLGLNKPSEYLSSIVDYAESRGVLLIAAAGNEGSVVKFPAAYPTVLAVGGAMGDNRADPRSNYGPELDVTAPWDVFTTAPGGSYAYKDGTSLAAPQVAAVGALIWSRHPEMKPADIRSMIRQTAEDAGPTGWDSRNGFGLLRADLALRSPFRPDPFEPNDRPSDAKAIPLGKRVDAVMDGAADPDYYLLDAPYDGTVYVKAEADIPGAVLQVYAGKDPSKIDKASGNGAQGFVVPVSKGKNFLLLKSARSLGKQAPYHITTRYQIYSDPYDDNNRQYKAYALAARSQAVTGTFSEAGDQDWYQMTFTQPGTLALKLSADTPRIDPALLVQKEGESAVTYDRLGEGKTESTGTITVEPGTYYFRAGNAVDFASPITGEYTLHIDYATKSTDPNEPNDRAYQAVSVVPGADYKGIVDAPGDADWFRFKLEEERSVELTVKDVPVNAFISAELTDDTLQPLQNAESGPAAGTLSIRARLKAGTYYVKLAGSSRPFSASMYNFSLNTDK